MKYKLNKVTAVPATKFGKTKRSEKYSGFSTIPKKKKNIGKQTIANNTNKIKYNISLNTAFITFKYRAIQ